MIVLGSVLNIFEIWVLSGLSETLETWLPGELIIIGCCSSIEFLEPRREELIINEQEGLVHRKQPNGIGGLLAVLVEEMSPKSMALIFFGILLGA